MSRLGAVAIAVILVAALSSSASGASACAAAVLRDWSDDGIVAPKYSLPCYEQAIDALPPDLRDYTDAEAAIVRALSNAVRVNGTPRPTGAESQGAPLVLTGLAGAALFVFCAGGVGYLARRRRASRLSR